MNENILKLIEQFKTLSKEQQEKVLKELNEIKNNRIRQGRDKNAIYNM